MIAMVGAILAICGVVLGGAFLAMYLAICSNRNDPARSPAFRQHLMVELVWATIPLVILLAAAFPAVVTVVSRGSH
jgi:heme/copper-type cytochrome/quinol oxidase subunit 2